MRIGTKLLITYLVLIGVVGLVAVTALPRWVERTVITADCRRLKSQADTFATQLAARISQRRLSGIAPTVELVESLLTDQELLVVDAKGVVQRSSDPALERIRIPLPALEAAAAERSCAVPNGIPVSGQRLMATAQMTVDGKTLFTLLLFRDVNYVRNLAGPIATRMMIAMVFLLLASLAVIGMLSRDFVWRLRGTSNAARALAEGDLTQRAPVSGSDEIADLGHHFNHMAERIQSLVEGLRKSEGLRREMLVTLSHELRTPLTSIAGFAEALKDGVVKEESQKQRYYQIIASESARLKRMINDVFDVARLEAGQVEFRLQAMPVAPWLMEFAEGFSEVAESEGARLELKISPEAERARIYGDRDRLDQALTNLMANALRFSPPGECVTLSADVEGEDVVIAVTDRGPGLEPGDAERVFERFWQGKNKGRGHVGAGLGLAIVKSTVEGHGGQVGVTSTPGQGARFWIRLKQITG